MWAFSSTFLGVHRGKRVKDDRFFYRMSGCWEDSFLKWGYPQIINVDWIFHYNPTILGIHHLWKAQYFYICWVRLGYWFPGTAPICNWSHAEWREVVLHHWHASNMYDMEVSENRGTLNHPRLFKYMLVLKPMVLGHPSFRKRHIHNKRVLGACRCFFSFEVFPENLWDIYHELCSTISLYLVHLSTS